MGIVQEKQKEFLFNGNHQGDKGQFRNGQDGTAASVNMSSGEGGLYSQWWKQVSGNDIATRLHPVSLRPVAGAGDETYSARQNVEFAGKAVASWHWSDTIH